jgi:hypothetical protein
MDAYPPPRREKNLMPLVNPGAKKFSSDVLKARKNIKTGEYPGAG